MYTKNYDNYHINNLIRTLIKGGKWDINEL